MYAVVETGGKQYRVQSGDVIKVEKLAGVAGEKIALDKILVASDGASLKIGAPVVAKAAVEAEILEQGKGDKVIVFKKKRRQNYRRKNGHRQELTTLRVTSISVDGKKSVYEKKAAAKAEAVSEEVAEKKPAAKKTAKAKSE
jgi:large subunit ribosomal protein L21